MLTLHQSDQQVLGSSAFGIHAHGQRGIDALPTLDRQAGEGAQHRCEELVKREDRGGRESRQDDDGLAIGDRETDGLAGLERNAVSDDAWIAEAVHDAVGEIAGTLGCAAGEHDRIGLQTPCERARPARSRRRE